MLRCFTNLTAVAGILAGCQSMPVESVSGSEEEVLLSEVVTSQMHVEIHDGVRPVLGFGMENEGDTAICFPSYWFAETSSPAGNMFKITDLTTGKRIKSNAMGGDLPDVNCTE